jgi:hypothetical protein
MKSLLTIYHILIFAFSNFILQSCFQDRKKDDGKESKSAKGSTEQGVQRSKHPNRITIFKTYYEVSIDGKSTEATSKGELMHKLKSYKSTDTLFLSIRDASSAQIENALECLQELRIKNFKTEVSDDYFQLPY